MNLPAFKTFKHFDIAALLSRKDGPLQYRISSFVGVTKYDQATERNGLSPEQWDEVEAESEEVEKILNDELRRQCFVEYSIPNDATGNILYDLAWTLSDRATHGSPRAQIIEILLTILDFFRVGTTPPGRPSIAAMREQTRLADEVLAELIKDGGSK